MELIGWERSKEVDKALSLIPFENLNDSCPTKLSSFYCDILSAHNYNYFHNKLAYYLSAGILKYVITTNYDNAIRLALDDMGVNINIFWDESSFKNSGSGLFKIHGCVTDQDSLVYELSQETKLQPDKQKILTRLIYGQRLIVLGYSGIDFEVCPGIAEAKPKEILWIKKPGDKLSSPGQIYLKNNHVKVSEIEWDLGQGLPWNRQNLVPGVSALTEEKILNKLSAYIDKKSVQIWAIDLASRIGYVNLGKYFIDKYGAAICGTRQELNYRLLFHAGKYHTAARALQKFAKQCLRKGDKSRAAEHYLESSDAWRCYFGICKCLLTLRRGRKIVESFTNSNQQLSGLFHLKAALAITSIFDICYKNSKVAKLFRNISNRLSAWAVKHLYEAHTCFGKSGDMFALKQTENILSKLEKGRQEAGLYGSLGYSIAFSTSYRSAILEKASLNNSELEELEYLYLLMIKMGSMPEAWKTARALRILKAHKKIPCLYEEMIWKKNCEYSIIGKLLLKCGFYA